MHYTTNTTTKTHATITHQINEFILPTIPKTTNYKTINYTKNGVGIHKPPMETKIMEEGTYAISDWFEDMILSEDKTGTNKQDEFWWENGAGMVTMEMRNMNGALLDLFFGWCNDFNSVFLARCARREKFIINIRINNEFQRVTKYEANMQSKFLITQNDDGEWTIA